MNFASLFLQRIILYFANHNKICKEVRQPLQFGFAWLGSCADFVRDRRFSGFKFRRQVTIGSYIADFACFDRKVIVEADGSQHGEAGATRRVTLGSDRKGFASDGFGTPIFWFAPPK